MLINAKVIELSVYIFKFIQFSAIQIQHSDVTFSKCRPVKVFCEKDL